MSKFESRLAASHKEDSNCTSLLYVVGYCKRTHQCLRNNGQLSDLVSLVSVLSH